MNGLVSSRAVAWAVCATVTCALAVAQGIVAGGQPRVSEMTALPVTMPFEVVHGAVTVDAGLGPGLPLKAVVDTGMSDCLVSTSQASRRGIGGVSEVALSSPLGQIRATPIGSHGFRFGRVVVEALPICAGDPYAQWTDTPPNPVPDAWIGNTCLSLFTLEIDGPGKEIRLGRSEAPPMRGPAPFPFSLDQGRVAVRALVNGSIELVAIVSTAVRGTLITSSVYRRLNTEPGSERTVKLPDGARARVGSARLKELRLGATRLADVDVIAVLDDVPGIGGNMGIIGTDVLLRHRMQISYHRMQMQLAPPQAGARERGRPSGRPTMQPPSGGAPTARLP